MFQKMFAKKNLWAKFKEKFTKRIKIGHQMKIAVTKCASALVTTKSITSIFLDGFLME
jgi:hypothetical protein